MNQVANYIDYLAIVDRYGQKGVRSNDYIQKEVADLIQHDALYVDCYEKNVFLFVKKVIGMRMYYYINDLDELADFGEYSDLVTEILFRGELPQTEIDYFLKCGFKINLVRDQYAGIYKDLAPNVALVSGVRIETAQNIEQVKTACELFNANFDAHSGDFIPESVYPELLNSGSILVAWDSDMTKIKGALHQVKEGAVSVVGHVAVEKDARGQGIGKALVDTFVEWSKNKENTEKTRYQLWVQRQNVAAVKMYQNKGFKYINKSTISLIKY